MTITKKLKDDMKLYNINLPVRKGLKAELRKRRMIIEQYEQYLRDLVREAKRIDKKIVNRKIKYYQKQVVERKKQTKITEIGISKAKVLYFKNKLLFMSPTESSFKSYWKYTVWNDRGYLAGLSNISEDEVISNIFQAKLGYTTYSPPVLTVEEIQRFIHYHSVKRFLMNKLHYKVWISIVCLTLKHNEISNLSITSNAIIIRNSNDINNLLQNLYRLYEQQAEQSYNQPFRLSKINIHIAKINALTGSSLYDWIVI